ncbi:Pancreatic triacylglycerol lipase [Holothuria leucospilota]|uniref:Pancreatic triacylglycerol lipase n=1 Tax=Holothuria leucospilota TaxID=206669 RepID=A0A9Q0YRU4_HOLLE|nr:Pancreatic triacylglycerol lipase [Holothuria leucospilota]
MVGVCYRPLSLSTFFESLEELCSKAGPPRNLESRIIGHSNCNLLDTILAAKEVCYEGFGCFDTSLPCNKISVHLPQSPSEINTEFLLYTPENPKTEQVIDWNDDDSIINSNFQGSRDTKFFIHGYTDDAKRPVNQDMKDALLSKGNFNVILVNWKGGSRAEIAEKLGNIANLKDVALSSLAFLKLLPDYLQARQNTRLVGRQIGELSRKLQQLTGAPFARMHLIGHSLGAHVAGYAGENVNGQYGRITGLDPAGPGYRPFSFEKGCLLEKSDAAFVDIIHTDHILGIQTAVSSAILAIKIFIPAVAIIKSAVHYWIYLAIILELWTSSSRASLRSASGVLTHVNRGASLSLVCVQGVEKDAPEWDTTRIVLKLKGNSCLRQTNRNLTAKSKANLYVYDSLNS